MTRALLLLILAVAVAVSACGGAASGPGRTPVVVDTDLGPDDALALLYLVSRGDVDVRAVAVSGTGLARCPAGAVRAMELLAAAGRADIPVACGRDDPLAGFNAFPPEWRDPLDAVPLPRTSRAPDRRGAARLLADEIARAPGAVTVVALGPLTDVAELLRDHPTVARHIKAVHAMGGTLDAPGNIGPGHEGAEYNLWIDPVAADAVVRGGVPVAFVGLDATNDVPVTVFFADALHRNHYANPAAALAWEILDDTGMQRGGNYFWDPLAAMAAAARWRDVRVRVTRDGRLVRAPAGIRERVAVGADRPRFESELLATLTHRRVAIGDADAGASIVCTESGCTYSGPREARGSGAAAVDTVNHSGRTMTHSIGRLSEGRTAADLRRLLRRGEAFKPPVWFSPVATGSTPPHSSMTWLVEAEPGDYAIVATGPHGTQVIAGIRVSG